MPGYQHVDVFARRPYTGNGLPVFVDPAPLTDEQMLAITQELRQFESIFLTPTPDPNVWRARVYDLFGELAFAGHPVLGAAAVLARRSGAAGSREWTILVPGREVLVTTSPLGDGYRSVARLAGPSQIVRAGRPPEIAPLFDLADDDLRADLPLEVIDVGLRYLIVPVREGALGRAVIRRDITDALRAVGAEFAVLYDEVRLEVRHWNNDGVIEDVATGSAAVAIAAYRLRHGRTPSASEFELHQGRYTGRPSVLSVCAFGTAESIDALSVGGDVAFVGRGEVRIPG